MPVGAMGRIPCFQNAGCWDAGSQIFKMPVVGMPGPKYSKCRLLGCRVPNNPNAGWWEAGPVLSIPHIQNAGWCDAGSVLSIPYIQNAG